MKCPNCGAELREGQTSCPTCGSAPSTPSDYPKYGGAPKSGKKKTALVLILVLLILALAAGGFYLYQQNKTPTGRQTSGSSSTGVKSAIGKLTIRKEVKDALDSIVDFYEEYAAFMKKYAASPNSLSMISEYARYIDKVDDMSDKLDAIEDWDLNEAEEDYYWEVWEKVMNIYAEATAYMMETWD